MNPKPLSSLNHFTVPVGMSFPPRSCAAIAEVCLRRDCGRCTLVPPNGRPAGHDGTTWPSNAACCIIRAVAYDEDLADRIREMIADTPGVTEKKMFGGLAFLVGGNMAVAASGRGGLMVRVDPGETDALLERPNARPFEMRGRAMDGWLRVEAEGVRTKRQLEPWVKRGVAYARSLPTKR